MRHWKFPPAMTKTSLDKNKIKILLLEGVHPTALEAFRADGYTNDRIPPEIAARSAVARRRSRDAYFVGIRSATQLTAEVFEHAPRLIGVGCFCIGTNQVDLDGRGGARHPGVQRAVLQHPQRGRTGAGRNHPADARHPGPQRRRPSRRVGEDRRRLPRSARQDAGHRRLRPHRHAGGRAGRSAAACRWSTTTSRRSWRSATPAPCPRSTRCSKRPTS